MPLYVCRKWQGQVQPQENQMLKWVFANDLQNYKMLDADIPLIAPLRDLL